MSLPDDGEYPLVELVGKSFWIVLGITVAVVGSLVYMIVR